MISGKILRDAIISGANNINNQRSRVDELNVFPVPDGDTGTNMGMTVGASVRELEALDDSCTVGEAAKTAASAMLRGARGNSGVITSLLFRGFSKALEGKKEADVADIVAALQKGVEGAYKAVMKPTEGTILTVARVAAEKSRTALTDTMEPLEIWDLIIQYAEEALARIVRLRVAGQPECLAAHFFHRKEILDFWRSRVCVCTVPQCQLSAAISSRHTIRTT